MAKQLFGDIFMNSFAGGYEVGAAIRKTKEVMRDRADRQTAKQVGADVANSLKKVDGQWEEYQARKKMYEDDVFMQRRPRDEKEENLFEAESVKLRSEMYQQKLDLSHNAIASYPDNEYVVKAYTELGQQQVTALENLQKEMFQKRAFVEAQRAEQASAADREDKQAHDVEMENLSADNAWAQSTHTGDVQMDVAKEQDRLKRARVSEGYDQGYGSKAQPKAAAPMSPKDRQAMIKAADEFGYGQAKSLSPDALASIKSEFGAADDEEAQNIAAGMFANENLAASGAPDEVIQAHRKAFLEGPLSMREAGRADKKAEVSPEHQEILDRREQAKEYLSRLDEIKDPELRAHTEEWANEQLQGADEEEAELAADEDDFTKEVASATDFKWVKFSKGWNSVMDRLGISPGGPTNGAPPSAEELKKWKALGKSKGWR